MWAVHRNMLTAMTGHIKVSLIKLLRSWEQDETGSFKDSFIISEPCLKTVDEDHVSETSRPDLNLQIESAQVIIILRNNYRFCCFHERVTIRMRRARTSNAEQEVTGAEPKRIGGAKDTELRGRTQN